jgi:ADP-ribose pyrophosphatase
MNAGRIGSERVYSGRVISVDVDSVRFPNGFEGSLEIVRHPGASAVVPFVNDPHGTDPRIILLRQYRYAAEGKLYEIPAGRLDPGESPLECAHRELKEETGCTAGRMERLLGFYTTPGFTDERIELFMASELEHGETGHESDEFIEAETVLLSDALSMIQNGRIVDGKTIVGILFAARFRLPG